MDNCDVNVMDYLQYYLSDRDEDADPEDQSDDEISTTLSMASYAESLDSVATLTYDEGPDAQGAEWPADFRLDYKPDYSPGWSGDFWFPDNTRGLVPGAQRLHFPAGPAELD